MEAVVERFTLFSFLFIPLLLVLLHSPLCFSEKNRGEAIETQEYVKNVIKVSSTCSASTTTKDSHDQFSEESLFEDQHRVDSLHEMLSRNSPLESIRGQKLELAAKTGLSLKTGTRNYIVQVGFGTPTKSISLMFDTGSDLTWIQCEYQFDSSKSTSYSNIRCNTTECSELKSTKGVIPSCWDDSTCKYTSRYGGKSSIGYFAKEKITLTPDVFSNFKFGCGINNQGRFGSSAGILGLGRNKLSFVSQTFQKYGGVFSYCLPSSSSSTGYLSFGREKEKNAYESVKFTPLITDRRSSSFYFIKLIAITVDGTKLPVSASVFKTSGMIIDSATSITRLPPSAYTAFKSAIHKHMESIPTAPSVSILDTCYNITGFELWSVPSVSLVFEGNVEVDFAETSMVGGGAGIMCMAFAANAHASDVAILGNSLQQKLKMVYDIPQKKIGFGPIDCN